MYDLHLTLNGRVADVVASNNLVKLTQARAALADLNSRVGEYSFLLSLPATRNNARIFGVSALHPLGLDKFRGRDYAYELRIDGQLFVGIFRLASLKDGYTGQLLGAGFSWALLLGEKKLTDLRFSEIEYDGTQLAGILAKNCDETDAQFPLLSFGNFYHPPRLETQPDGSQKEVPSPPAAVLDWPLSVDDYAPGVYLRNVLRQIFAESGWSLSARVLDEAFWREVVLTCAGADVATAWNWGALLPASASNGTQNVDAYSYYDSDPLNTGSQYSNTAIGWDESREVYFLPVPTPHVISSPTRALDARRATFTAPQAGTYTFVWSTTCTILQQTIDNNSINPGLPSSPVAAGFRAVGLGLVVNRAGAGWTGADGGLCTYGFYESGQDRVVSYATPAAGASASGIAASIYLEATDTVTLCLFAQRRFSNGLLVRQELYAQFSAVSFACTLYYDNDGVRRLLLQPSAFLPPLGQLELVAEFMRRTDTVPVADFARRTVHLLTRSEQAQAAGEPLDISPVVDPDSMEYAPTLGASVGALAFRAADAEDPLLPAGDVVRVAVGPDSGEQAVESLFAPMAYRPYRLPSGSSWVSADIATAATADSLTTNRDETAWDIAGAVPRLVRYTGPHATITVPFGTGTVPLATSTWAGPLAWSGPAGAVATYYAGTVRQVLRGHLTKCTANLSPALYRQLAPGRAVYLYGAAYALDSVNSYALCDEGNQTSIELLRQL